MIPLRPSGAERQGEVGQASPSDGLSPPPLSLKPLAQHLGLGHAVEGIAQALLRGGEAEAQVTLAGVAEGDPRCHAHLGARDDLARELEAVRAAVDASKSIERAFG